MDSRSDLARMPSAELYESIRQSLLDVGASEGDDEMPWTPERRAEVEEWRRLARLAAKELGCRVRTFDLGGDPLSSSAGTTPPPPSSSPRESDGTSSALPKPSSTIVRTSVEFSVIVVGPTCSSSPTSTTARANLRR